MAAVDTNVLVRYLVQDSPAQLAAAKRLFEQCLRQGETLFVPITVSLELEWVLRHAYGFTKVQVADALSVILSLAELSLEHERALEIALHNYRKTNADYADCLHVALSAEASESPFWTFDKKASKVIGAQLVPA